ncbi:unnamed protein product [Rotaria socialis]|uniref:Neurotransmitter-gated ion-channel ligand-binding domain-containing protein n=2 Tax=Rotaria socialis TaxID=392032 RepID=A0A820UVZ0_9BILA|nr:unnamed protein product [Rotaria socialis]CAF3648325.1 unnamed protein product [Rotaria socialis]CAF4134661.1 unnamed protein product [Rotaria socialis]CAF4491369.1 unnamed protein product [Rotaria socialis]
MTERPTSARSVQKGGRQLLQMATNRRVNAKENDAPAGSNQSNTTEHDSKNSTFNWSTGIANTKATSVDVNGVVEEKYSDSNSTPLKNLVFKQLDKSPIEVHVRCVFMRVGDIDTLNERYYAEILFEASWEEPRLKGTPKEPFNAGINWTPQLELLNGIGELNDNIAYSVFYDRQGLATVTEHHKLKGTLWERMELQYFPFDLQDLSLSVTTSRSGKEMFFVKNLRKPSGANCRVFTDEQEWYLFEHVDIETKEEIEEYLDDGHNHSVVICSCHAARKYGYYIWNAYFLIFLITSASFTTFPIPLTNISGRVQISCTLLLTSITFRWLCDKALPTISYLTAVDVYAIGSIFSLCLLNIYNGVIGYVYYYISTNTTNSATTVNVHSIIIIDRWALVVYTILFFVYQFGTLAWMYLVPWKERRNMFRMDKINRIAFAPKYDSRRATFMDILRSTTVKRKVAPTVPTITEVDQS